MGRLTVSGKLRMITLSLSGYKPSKVVSKLAGEGIATTRLTVYRVMKKYFEQKKVSACQKSGRNKILTVEQMNFIDECYYENDELTSVDLQKTIFEKFNLNLSLSSLKRIRIKLGWKQSGPKYCQAIRPINCLKRLQFVQQCITSEDNFSDVVFTDESSVHIKRHVGKYFRKKGQPHKMKPTVKHPYKVHVWGGISRHGKSRLVIFTGIMRKV